MILSFSVYPTNNLGDEYCSPVHYFTFGEPVVRLGVSTFKDFKKFENPTAVIIGGGGLIAPFAIQGIKDIIDFYGTRCPIIGWGLGFNYHFTNSKVDNLSNASKDHAQLLNGFNLLGLRDNSTTFEWLPCVSCMHPLFETSAESHRDFVIYEHRDHPIDIPDIPKLNNFSKNFGDVIKFLSSAKCVITNSYHGVYWATLLKRKVVCVPFSSRFMSMKFPPTFLNSWNEFEDRVKEASTYPDARNMCIRQNLNFYGWVMNEILLFKRTRLNPFSTAS